MMKAVGLLMCLPAGSKAFVERIFSHMNYIWTEDKSRLNVETAVLTVKTNVGSSC